MPSNLLSRLSIFSILLVLVVIASSILLIDTSGSSSGGARRPASGLVVHEWGTFTSVVGREGHPLEWRPLSFESDLPSFVYSIDMGALWRGLRYPTKSSLSYVVRMETPVLYFYSAEASNVSVNVDFPGGRITEWYPRATVSGGSINWGQVNVLPGTRVYFPHDGRNNHYYPARETDAVPVGVMNDSKPEHEKFLFYRGVGSFDLPLTIRLQEDEISIKQSGDGELAKVIVFENRDGRCGYLISDLDSDGVKLARPTLNNNLNHLRQDLKAMLISHGLFEKEAEAMLNVWRDSWFEEGLRVFYVLPKKSTDAILPISIEPKPVELARVMVGRTELITPEMENDVAEHVEKLQDSSITVRDEALKGINKYGRFAAPILEQVHTHSTTQEIRTNVMRLLQKMRQQ